MGKAIRASVLLLLLASSASAGDIQNDVKGPTPPPAPVTREAPQDEPATGGYIPNGEPDGLTETVLAMLESVLALF